jgi:hypothetical protein
MGDTRQRAAGYIRHAPVLNIGVRDTGADDDSVCLLFHLPKFVDACDIEEKIGLDEAHVEHGPERLTTSYDFDGTAGLSEQQ